MPPNDHGTPPSDVQPGDVVGQPHVLRHHLSLERLVVDETFVSDAEHCVVDLDQFRLPEGASLDQALQIVKAAEQQSGANRSKLRDVLSSGSQIAGVRFQSTGEPALAKSR